MDSALCRLAALPGPTHSPNSPVGEGRAAPTTGGMRMWGLLDFAIYFPLPCVLLGFLFACNAYALHAVLRLRERAL